MSSANHCYYTRNSSRLFNVVPSLDEVHNNPYVKQYKKVGAPYEVSTSKSRKEKHVNSYYDEFPDIDTGRNDSEYTSPNNETDPSDIALYNEILLEMEEEHEEYKKTKIYRMAYF